MNDINFSDCLSFAVTLVEFKTVMLFLGRKDPFIKSFSRCSSVYLIYDISCNSSHLFICYGFITNSHIDQLLIGLIAQMVEFSTVNPRIKGSTAVLV